MNFRTFLNVSLASLTLAACAGEVEDSDLEQAHGSSAAMVIDATTIARLAAHESLTLDLTSPDAHYTLDTSHGAIATSRIAVLTSDGVEHSLEGWHGIPAELDHGTWEFNGPSDSTSGSDIGMTQQALMNNGAGDRFVCGENGCVGVGEADCAALRAWCGAWLGAQIYRGYIDFGVRYCVCT